jgi:hypothetical protein
VRPDWPGSRGEVVVARSPSQSPTVIIAAMPSENSQLEPKPRANMTNVTLPKAMLGSMETML